ncbi:MAG: bifunctional phosphopantothenoylcysteine decarboxylase/phosphopantothenate--cysteine ligase CoaBC, partial [Deltaproteobacteria bacterium]|nr:bifunctional phosphopantothenoylcysteine decarboxylase/phosphopantothenate--cysteine ligase CoaBC [Deltaproteobacteria bacterium]
MGNEPKKILLGVCGGIACYKSLEFVRGLKNLGHEVTVVMTRSAQEFVGPLSFQTLSGNSVALDLFSLDQERQIGHIQLARESDALVVAPATANMIGKMAGGIADDYLSTLFLAMKVPVLIAPAMNSHMWENPAVQDNLRRLKQRGVEMIDPQSGYLACGDEGIGRMASPDSILERLLNLINKKRSFSGDKPLSDIPVLITAGPTREKIDAVRYISNYSSGKMGYALAEVCQKLGAKVSLISGPVSIDPPEQVERIMVSTALEMQEAVTRKAEGSRLIIMAAAVSDFRIERPSDKKIKKNKSLDLKLVENPDILKLLGAQKKSDWFLVGFAAETDNILEYGKKKLIDKNLDLIVVNNVMEPGAGFDVDTNKVLLVDNQAEITLPMMDKNKVAEKILESI